MAYNIVGNGYNYLGVTATTPPNLQINPNAPTINNMNANIGDFWLQQDTTNLWFLTSLANQQAIWTPIGGGGGGGDVNTLTGDTGPAVTSTGNNIDVNGGLNINTSGAASTLTVSLNTSILQPQTSIDGLQGVYALGSTDYITDRFLHNAGSESNVFLGRQSGNLSNTSSNTVAIGFGSATNITSGQDNVLIGYRSGYSLTSQSDNVFVGLRSGATISDLTSTQNTLMGSDTLINATLSLGTTTLGYRSLYSADSSTGNTCLGALTGFQLLTGNYNLFLGAGTGAALTSNESNNILICNTGTPSDSNTIRIGTQGSGTLQQNKAYIAGVYNNTVDAGTQQTVVIDSDGKLGSVIGGAGDITDVNSGDNITVNTVGTVATVNLNKSILQPVTNAAGTEGLYSLGGDRFLHNYGTNNTFVGTNAGNLTLVGGGSDNVAVGNLAGNALSSGFNNVFIGPEAGSSNTSGETNIFVGLQSGLLNTSGTGNIAIGILALSGAATAQNNLIFGNASGTNYTGSESDNILISSEGVLGDNNVLRIGDSGTGDYQVDSAYIAGTYARTVDGGTQQFVVIDSVGKLGSVIGGGGGGDVNTLTGDTGPAVTSTGNNIDVNGGDNINTSGAASTLTINLDTSISQPDTNASGTEGLYSLGGNRFLHNYGTSNVFLGRSAGNLTLTGAGNTVTGALSGSSISSGVRNSIFGFTSGQNISSGTNNCFFGAISAFSMNTGQDNVAIGYSSLTTSAASSNTIAIGSNALSDIDGGDNNIAIGSSAGANMSGTPAKNILIGTSAASNYVANESSNIIIGNAGVASENHVIRIGTDGTGAGQQDEAYIAGTYNRSVGSTAGVVMIDSNTKLGSSNGSNGQVLIGGGTKPAWANITSTDGSITITNGVNSIDLSSDGGGGTISGTYSTTIVGYAGYTYSPDIVQIPVDAVLHINFSVIGAGKYTSGVNNGKSVGMIQESTYGAIRQDGGSSVFVFAGVDELKSIYRQNFTTFGTTTIVIDMVEGSDPSYVRFRFNANQNTSGNLTVGFTINYSYFITNSPV